MCYASDDGRRVVDCLLWVIFMPLAQEFG